MGGAGGSKCHTTGPGLCPDYVRDYVRIMSGLCPAQRATQIVLLSGIMSGLCPGLCPASVFMSGIMSGLCPAAAAISGIMSGIMSGLCPDQVEIMSGSAGYANRAPEGDYVRIMSGIMSGVRFYVRIMSGLCPAGVCHTRLPCRPLLTLL